MLFLSIHSQFGAQVRVGLVHRGWLKAGTSQGAYGSPAALKQGKIPRPIAISNLPGENSRVNSSG
jgi:hypothetical protein